MVSVTKLFDQNLPRRNSGRGRISESSDIDAASDPMSDPQVKAALKAASFELLVGFQLSDTALAYNIAK